tara:strand:- start:4596 stop:5168 length:573 start_codon:yes stop_codon:yes gene_type:complete
MAESYNYSFDNPTRLGNDGCGTNDRDVQNSSYGSYITTNFFSGCDTKRPMAFATKQPNVFVKGGLGPGACNISDDSVLKIGSLQTHPKCKISLQQRPFATVPFLGKGPPRPILESRLQQGSSINDLKSCKTIMETGYNNATPLIPSVQATIQNPHNLVEGVAATGWIRGGLPSRDLTRNQDYLERHTPST